MRLPSSNLQAEPPRSVFVLKPSSFGDVLHTLPAIARLKAVWPSARITWMVNPEWMPLLEGNPDLNGTLPFPRGEFRGWLGWSRFYNWQKQNVRGHRPDLALDFQGLLRTAVIGRLSTPRRFLGMADAREGARWLYDRIAPTPAGVPHSVERYLALVDFALADAGSDNAPSRIVPTHFALPPGEPPAATAIAGLNDDFVLLHPFARGGGKSLSAQQVEGFCRCLAPRQVILVGRKPTGVGNAPSQCLDLLNCTTLSQLIWIMRRAAFVISVDSGPAHLAAALQRPLVAIHTWSDPRRVGPYQPSAWVWKNGQLARMADLGRLPDTFFQAKPGSLTAGQIEAICALIISP